MLFKWWWLLLFYLVVLGFLSLNPWLRPNPEQAIGFIAWDLLDHAVAYGLLSVLLMSAFIKRRRSLAMTFMVVVAASLIGVLFEYCQYWFTSTRQFSFYDAVANIFGSVLGVAAFQGVHGFLFVTKSRHC
ncbi:MAG: VanZ family protein [Methylobacter sp.]|nr:VanZ family protein [Methylobacter sp.]